MRLLRGSTMAVVMMMCCSMADLGAQERPRPERGLTQLKHSLPAATVIRKQYPKDNQPHPDDAYRIDKMRAGGWGDTRVTESVAGHAVIYAKQRYGISDVVSDADYERAVKEMYDFVSWKYGHPSAVAAQWITAGYQHFDSFAAEAAAALVGMELPGPGDVITLPRELTTWLKTQVDSMQKDPAYNPCSDPVTMFVGAGCDVLFKLATDAASTAAERIAISAQVFNVKRAFKVNDTGAEFMIYLKRNPTQSLRPHIKPAHVVASGSGNF